MWQTSPRQRETKKRCRQPPAEGPPPDGAFVLDDAAGIGAVVGLAQGNKCPRCFRILPEVAANGGPGNEICGRCADAVEAHESAA